MSLFFICNQDSFYDVFYFYYKKNLYYQLSHLKLVQKYCHLSLKETEIEKQHFQIMCRQRSKKQ
jgi:hypothetical protein